MANQALLSELCSICHINTPKYCCPGCSTRTCSLKCVQRHKEWAQCSGKRDPSAYVKKAQLASASGVDHDYNFIFGIEQSRDRAEERLEEKVKQGEDARSAKLNHTNYRNRLHQARVNVEYAPVGMSRQKLNKTRLAKSKRILWTVEWVHEDRSTSIGQLFDDVPISREYGQIYIKQPSTLERKRKRDAGAGLQSPQPYPGDLEARPVEGQAPAKEAAEGSTLKREDEPGLSQADDESLAKQIPVGSARFPAVSITKNEAGREKEPSTTLPAGSPDAHGLYYYLVKPRTSGAQKILIPLSPTDSFLNCLQNQTVLEFPTIQVWPHQEDALPADCITEKEYLTRFKKEADEMEQLIAESGVPLIESSISDMDHDTRSMSDIPLPSAVLATLEQDMNRGW